MSNQNIVTDSPVDHYEITVKQQNGNYERTFNLYGAFNEDFFQKWLRKTPRTAIVRNARRGRPKRLVQEPVEA